MKGKLRTRVRRAKKKSKESKKPKTKSKIQNQKDIPKNKEMLLSFTAQHMLTESSRDNNF